MLNLNFKFAISLLYLVIVPAVFAQSIDDRQLAIDVTNPLAKIVKIPFIFDYAPNMNPNNTGNILAMLVEPLVPININPRWYIISRTIFPVIRHANTSIASGAQFGLGDTLQDFFISPNKKSGALLWGVGPTILIPTDTNQALGSGRWAIGPGGVLIKITGPWTLGLLANHVWSGKGGGGPYNLSFTRVNSKIEYTTNNAWTLSLTSDPTYDWVFGRKVVPINLSLNKIVNIGKTPISIGGGMRYFIPMSSEGAKGFGATANVVLLFPNSLG